LTVAESIASNEVEITSQPRALHWGKSTVANPKGEVIFGFIIVFLFFGLFLGWCAAARLDVAASGQGVVTVSGGSQAIQHKEGGVVRTLNVREGDHVVAGQVLMELASDEARGQERALLTRFVFRKLEVARLEAEISGQALVMPAAFASWSGEDRAVVDVAFANARSELQALRTSNATRRQALHQRIFQTREEIAGSQAQIAASRAQESLTAQDLDGVKALAAEGYAPKNRVRALQKDAAALEGETNARAAQMAGLRGAIGETSSEISHGDSDRAAQVADELQVAEADLESVQSQWAAAREQLLRMTVRAPVDGAVVGLTVHSVGAVVAPGQTIMTIVPKKAPLVVEAKFLPQDVDGLTTGREVRIKFPGIHDRNLPLAHGTLSRLSADTVIDEKTGQRFYTAEIKVPYEELARLSRTRSPNDPMLRPGQSALVLVPLRRRTALQYFVEPLQGIFWGALAER
jgi:HlyD family type I secretion membrane fusion protein